MRFKRMLRFMFSCRAPLISSWSIVWIMNRFLLFSFQGGYYRRRLEKTIQKEGDCERKRAHTADRVSYHYVGYNEHDMSVFDTSYQRATPYIFKMGEKTVIAGVDLGMHRACIGERFRLSIPPHLGYEDEGIVSMLGFTAARNCCQRRN